MATATFTDENNTTIVFTGKGQMTDYGVPGSPSWWEIDDVSIESIELEDGTLFTGKEITAEMHDKYIGFADGIDWDQEEYEGPDDDDRDYDNYND